MRIMRTIIVGLVGLLMATTTLADTVETTDGSRLVGTIVGMADGRLTIDTQIAGQLKIDVAKIVSITSDNPLVVKFASGDRLVGTMGKTEGGDRSVMKSTLGDIAIDVSKIDAMWSPDGEDPVTVALKKEVEQSIIAAKPSWSATLEAGGTRTEGNTDTRIARGRLDVTRKTNTELLDFYLAAKFNEQDGQRTVNEYRGGIRFEEKLDKKLFWYARTEFEFDEFEELDLRSTAALGGGYHWFNKPDHALKSSVGLGYRHESFDSGRSEDSAVIDLGANYRLDLAPWVHFTQSVSLSPSFDSFSDYRLETDTAFVIPLKNDRWKLKLGVQNEYNSQPQPGLDRLDSTYYANVVMNILRK